MDITKTKTNSNKKTVSPSRLLLIKGENYDSKINENKRVRSKWKNNT